LELLESLYGRAAEGESAAVLVWGEAGVGKTRLLDEFAARALALGGKIGRAACFESLCPPFAPLHEAFGTLGISDAFEARDARGDQSETARHRALLRAAEAFRAAALTPTLLIVDDLQWADYATLEFLTFLAARRTGRWLFLGAVRSEQLELDHPRREALTRLERQGAVSVAVPPLDADEMRRLVTSIWPDHTSDADRAIQRVCELADGKPYFAEELVNSAVIAPEGPFFDAPLSIRAGVLARFERLAPEERRILLYASVIGRSFDVPLLAQIAAVSDAVAASALARARDLQLVRETREAGGVLTFRHAITREILYHELLAFQTQTVHREIAECLTRQRDADPIDLAYHWNAAGDRERASAAYEVAGDSALSRNAHRDAEVAYRGAAASRNRDDATYAPLCEKFSRALSTNGQVEEACAVAERAVDAYEAAGDAGQAAAVAIRLARRVYESGRPEAAEATAVRALSLSGGTGRVTYGAYVTLAHFAALRGAADAAGAYLVSADETPGEHSALDRRNACMVRALIAATSGRLTDAFEEYERGAAIARDSNDPEQLAWTLNNYASRAMTTGWMDRAFGAYREAASCARSKDFGKVGATTIQGLAFAALLAGDLAGVRARQREDAQLPPGIAMTQTARAALAVRLAYYGHDDAEASRCVTPATLELAFSSGETQRIGLLAGCVAAYYDATQRREEADALRTRALRELNSVDFSFWLLDQLAGSAKAEERARARELLVEAARDSANRAARAHLALFDARLAIRRRAAAKTLAGEAAAQFEQIGWPWEQAQALELAGRHADAVELYRRHGFLRHARELARTRQRARHRAGRQQLTARELEVARLAAQGKSNRAIATELFIGERTVETHIAAIFNRFDLTSRRQLAGIVGDSPEQGEAKRPS
jgi:DNA-binding CsgD family transcriptional regulator/tetratricopeptide (TPR) repeat protein